PEKHYRRSMAVAAASLAFFGILYIYYFNMLVYSTPRGHTIGGFTVLPSVAQVMRADGLTASQVLPTAQYDPEQVWEHDSIANAQNLLLLLWVGFFGSLSSMFMIIILSMESSKSKDESPGWGETATPKPRQRRSHKKPLS